VTADAEWDLDRAFRHVAKLRGPQEALPELLAALHSGRLVGRFPGSNRMPVNI
jgi:hypothetical protein